jgi:hypothetical protein
MDGDLIYCDHCGARVAMRYRHAITGRLCWAGREHAVVEIGETPHTLSWTCNCGHVTAVTDSAPKDSAPKKKGDIINVDFKQWRRRGGSN